MLESTGIQMDLDALDKPVARYTIEKRIQSTCRGGAMKEQPCLLCQVAQGKIPAQKVLESDRIIAVMNTREPQARGHTVIFPKHHATDLREMDPQDLGEVALVARAIANAQGLENYNLLHNAGALAGQTIFHAHFHLIPKWSEQEGLRYTWKTDADFNQQESYLKIKDALMPRASSVDLPDSVTT